MDPGYQRAIVALDQITDDQVRACARVLSGVATLDTFAEGPNDDLFCPFDSCSWEQYSNEHHDEDCPITIARAIVGPEPR